MNESDDEVAQLPDAIKDCDSIARAFVESNRPSWLEASRGAKNPMVDRLMKRCRPFPWQLKNIEGSR